MSVAHLRWPLGPEALNSWRSRQRHQSRAVVRGGLVELFPVGNQDCRCRKQGQATARCRRRRRGGLGHNRWPLLYSSSLECQPAGHRPRNRSEAGRCCAPGVSVFQSHARKHRRCDEFDRLRSRRTRGVIVPSNFAPQGDGPCGDVYRVKRDGKGQPSVTLKVK